MYVSLDGWPTALNRAGRRCRINGRSRMSCSNAKRKKKDAWKKRIDSGDGLFHVESRRVSHARTTDSGDCFGRVTNRCGQKIALIEITNRTPIFDALNHFELIRLRPDVIIELRIFEANFSSRGRRRSADSPAFQPLLIRGCETGYRHEVFKPRDAVGYHWARPSYTLIQKRVMSLSNAKNRFPSPGIVEWLGIRTARGEPVKEVNTVVAHVEHGLIGDRFDGGAGSPRQVTLIQSENLEVVAKLLRKQTIDPALTRRNILVSGINLIALKERVVQIGEARLKITGGCPPCGKMETNLGEGGYNAMIGHGGVTATVVDGGTINIGDQLRPLDV